MGMEKFSFGMGIGIMIISAYLMLKGWVETGVVILIIGIITTGTSARIIRKKKKEKQTKLKK